jgi:hypothetical protein
MIKLTAQYSKKLGLPGFSSHMYQVSVETELATTDDVAGESQRLYHLLQAHVDGQITQTGFVPSADYGMEPQGGRHSNLEASPGRRWKCSDKQRALIFSIIGEKKLNKKDIEDLAVKRFGKGVRLLSKSEASGLINALLVTGAQEAHPNGDSPRSGSPRQRNPQRKEAA